MNPHDSVRLAILVHELSGVDEMLDVSDEAANAAAEAAALIEVDIIRLTTDSNPSTRQVADWVERLGAGRAQAMAMARSIDVSRDKLVQNVWRRAGVVDVNQVGEPGFAKLCEIVLVQILSNKYFQDILEDRKARSRVRWEATADAEARTWVLKHFLALLHHQVFRAEGVTIPSPIIFEYPEPDV